jgi:integrase
MRANTTVTLSSNTKYWQVFYYDSNGKRRAKSLGPKKKLSKRQAKIMCDRFAVELHMNPGRFGLGKAPRIGEYLRRYLASRTDLRPKTLKLHESTIRYLLYYFSPEIYIDKISRAAAADWRSALARGELAIRKKPVEATVCLHVRNAKVIFNHAVRDDLILFNPFDRLKVNAKQPDKKWKYVTKEELHKLLEACPSISWRLLLALCRLGGLRQGEALSLLWSSIDWQGRRMDIIAEKTGRRRVVPIEPELYSLLLEAFSESLENQQLVIFRGSLIRSNLWRGFGVICKRAGLERWADWCNVLRKNCETDWAQKYPQYVVSVWLGHGIEVSARHYLQVPEELYQKVAATNDAETATKLPQIPKNEKL